MTVKKEFQSDVVKTITKTSKKRILLKQFSSLNGIKIKW